ncbi:CotH protein [Clostridium puniceum]|uniref:CotH protein n=1 Tax=Clostridium puniceum TaxID=29367 RepID=A0A1S8TEQ2_9CLOT|nr:CotH kinase family protein [Clostridium puniceum]OOM76263.1 CotH protein [Clostridium puniceum]
MIKEKHKGYIPIIAILLLLIFGVSLVYYNKGKDTNETTEKTVSTVLDKESITEISIDIEDRDWQWLLDNATEEEFRSCNITINGETFNNVGIRPKGNTSLSQVASDDTTDRYSFKIKFDKYVDGQTYNGIESIVLNNIFQDNTYMKEYISYDLYDFLGVSTPEMSYSNIKVNNEEWGLYLAIEVLDERFLEKNFGTSEGNLYKPETMEIGGGVGGGNPPNGKSDMPAGGPPNRNGNAVLPKGDVPQTNQKVTQSESDETITQNQTAENRNEVQNTTETAQGEAKHNKTAKGGAGQPGGGKQNNGADFVYKDDEVSSYSTVRDSAEFKRTTDEDFKKVINMYKNLNDGTNLEEVLDVEEILKYFSVNTFLVNLDSYSGGMYHNYYLYENNGKCQILPWDLNASFSGHGISDASKAINFPIDNPVTGSLESVPLIGKLLEVDEYKELYNSYLEKISNKYFGNGHYSDLVNKIDNLIGDYVKEDQTAFCTYEEYQSAISEMKTFGEDRTKSVLAQLSGEQPSTTYGNITTTLNLSALGQMSGGGRPENRK